MRHPLVLAVLALAGTSGCEAAGHGEASAAASATIPAEQFDLEGTAAVIRDGRVRDGNDLETEINGNRRNRVDVDGDGKRDRLQVKEERDGDHRRFQVRALPSGRQEAKPDDVAVVVATVDVVPDGDGARVVCRYSDAVVVAEPAVVIFDAPIAVGTFCYWVLVIERPIFIGVGYVIIHEHHERGKHKHKK